MITNIQNSHNRQNSFGKTYFYDLQKGTRDILSEQDEKIHISQMLKKAVNDEFSFSKGYFFNKTFKSKDGDTFEMKPHTAAYYASSEYLSSDNSSKIVVIKDKEMNQENSLLYNSLAKILGVIPDKD